MARQGDRAALPAAPQDDLPGGRRHEPAGRRARSTTWCSSRSRSSTPSTPPASRTASGARARCPSRRSSACSTRTSTCRTWERSPGGCSRTSIRSATSPSSTVRSISSTTGEPGALGEQGVHRRHAEVAGRGLRARVARAVPHERDVEARVDAMWPELGIGLKGGRGAPPTGSNGAGGPRGDRAGARRGAATPGAGTCARPLDAHRGRPCPAGRRGLPRRGGSLDVRPDRADVRHPEPPHVGRDRTCAGARGSGDALAALRPARCWTCAPGRWT